MEIIPGARTRYVSTHEKSTFIIAPQGLGFQKLTPPLYFYFILTPIWDAYTFPPRKRNEDDKNSPGTERGENG